VPQDHTFGLFLGDEATKIIADVIKDVALVKKEIVRHNAEFYTDVTTKLVQCLLFPQMVYGPHY
jgi:hypothetical protein